MIRSMGRLLNVNPGFNPDRVLTMQTSMLGKAYATDEQVSARTDAIVARLGTLPGVEAAAVASQIPLGGNFDGFGFHVQERPSPNPANDPTVERYGVTPDYFKVMEIPLRRGRLFTAADRAGAEPVLIVGEQTARTLWAGADPIGQHVRIGGMDGPWRTVVGIVGDVRHRELAASPTMQMYTPQAQVTDSFLTIVIRTGGDAGSLTTAVRQAIRSVAPDLPLYETAQLRELVGRSVGPRRFVMVLLELFGAAALLMTAVGVYGVVSYSVAERTHEIGIRTALGATRRDIVRLVMAANVRVVSAGLAAGGVMALAANRLLEGSLYGVSGTDPASFGAAAAILLVVAAIAQAVPVARATRVDPLVALRQD
jgi:putative ABC transport system permease protein